MFDYLGTKAYRGPIGVGTIVRNSGYGSRLMRVVELVPGGHKREQVHWENHGIGTIPTQLPSTFHWHDAVVLETYGLLDYGKIIYPTRPRRIPGYVVGGMVQSLARGQYYGESMAGYLPVYIVSKMVTTEMAYREGRVFRKRVDRNKWRDPKQDRRWASKCRYPKHQLLNVAFLQGYDRQGGLVS